MDLTNGNAGTIHVASLAGAVTASGIAIQADDTGGGSNGGDVTVEAAGNVTLDDAQLFARGDFAATGGFGAGGTDRRSVLQRRPELGQHRKPAGLDRRCAADGSGHDSSR